MNQEYLAVPRLGSTLMLVIRHTATIIRGISRSLIKQDTNQYKTELKHYLSGGSFSPHVFDLEHVRIGREKVGAATPTRGNGPDHSTPMLKVPCTSFLESIDEVVLVKHPTRTQRIHTQFEDSSQSRRTRYSSIPASQDIHPFQLQKKLLKATIKAEYFNPQEGKSVYTERPFARKSLAIFFPFMHMSNRSIRVDRARTFVNVHLP